MHIHKNGPKNAPQSGKASPALEISLSSSESRNAVQSLQVMALYAAIVAGVILQAKCSQATAPTVAPHHAAGYAGPARESDGQTLAGLNNQGAQPTNGLFSCAPFAYARAMAGLGGDTREGVPVFLDCRSANPSKSCHPIALAAPWQDSNQSRSLNHG